MQTHIYVAAWCLVSTSLPHLHRIFPSTPAPAMVACASIHTASLWLASLTHTILQRLCGSSSEAVMQAAACLVTTAYTEGGGFHLQVAVGGDINSDARTMSETPARQLRRQLKAARQAAIKKCSGQAAGNPERFVVLFAGGKVLPAAQAAEPGHGNAAQPAAGRHASEEAAERHTVGPQMDEEQQMAEQQMVQRHAAKEQPLHEDQVDQEQLPEEQVSCKPCAGRTPLQLPGVQSPRLRHADMMYTCVLAL
jgi:hypothetical protein